MSTNDEDFLNDAIPEPDTEATPSERMHARTFADIIDKSLTNKTPAAMTADDRALVEVATVIRAANGKIGLAAEKQRSIIEDALRQAIGGAGAPKSGAVTPIGKAKNRRWVPWAVTAVSTMIAAAAVLVLWLRAPKTIVQEHDVAKLPETWRSRPVDPLIGPIARESAGDASSRIDYIFADRLDGYRDRRLSGRGGKP